LTHFSSSEDLKGKRGGFRRYLFGEEETFSIIKPYGVTVHKNRVYICDTGLAGLVVLDLSEETFEYFIPKGKGQLKLPINCAVDERGYLYVADANRKQIVVFDNERKYIHAFGETDNFKPTDVEIHTGKIWVSNLLGHAINVYGADNYELLEIIPGDAAGDGEYIRQSTNLSINNNILYVSDFGDFNIKRFSTGGAFNGVIGGYGNSPGRFTRPKGIALDRDENLYVVDAAFENVQIFNAKGALLMHFGGSYEGAGAMWLPAAVEISYENLSYFQPYVFENFELKYLIYVTNQYGPAKVNVYGFVENK
jgi:DNA-binding beta-propeller fold protein YncE